MRHRGAQVVVGVVASGMFVAATAVSLSGARQQASPPAAVPPAAVPAVSPQRALLDKYCITCHNDRVRAASLVLTSDKMDAERVGDNAEIWEKVIRKVRSGAMPPARMPRPPEATLQGFVIGLETALDRAAAAAPNPGSPVPHRLNRAEYTNAIRDLLALEIDGRSMLPPDDSGYGFDNIGSVLSLSPGLLEQYMLTAHKAARLAIGDPAQHPGTETHRILITTRQSDRMSEDLPFGSRGGTAFRYNFPLDGEYVVGVRMQKLYSSGQIRGIDRREEIEVRLDGRRIKVFTFGGKYADSTRRVGIGADADKEQTRYEMSGDDDLNVRFAAAAGPHVVGVSFVNLAMAAPETPYAGRMPVSSIANFSDADGLMQVDTIQIGAVETRQAGETPSRRQIFVCHPASAPPDKKNDERACADKILSRLTRLAYRRPATDRDLQPLLDIYRSARKQGDFEAGIELALERILIAPEFLFRIEQDPAKVAPSTAYRIGDIDLASRLSFFLWSSIPDDELLSAAEHGRLSDPKILEQQVRRMLADRRATALVTNFGGQWLRVRSTQAVTPDVNEFPEFDDNLRDAMQRETELFLESQLREDRPLVELLTANYTFLNQRLAEHYNIPGVYGTQFRRVTLSNESPRRGLLGQASVLTVSSYPTRTSPVLRGKFILELLGAPPPPPPPNVPALEATHTEGKVLSVREQMELHRRNPVCASCHASMDPLGFALENFDAVGKFRTAAKGGVPIDAAAALPDGTKFEGAGELRDLLVSRRQEFISAFVEKFLTYAIGRGVEYYDQPVIRSIMRQAAPSDYRWSSIILGIARSVPFQQRRSVSQQSN
jgi:Protein of unknown function (DUF1592)/Protein of unknown function (DUF1588)/Protein of unknown function (DUF1587)/Protein of unknown function (DUF1585)/Protein of unknown function (DUF1595)